MLTGPQIPNRRQTLRSGDQPLPSLPPHPHSPLYINLQPSTPLSQSLLSRPHLSLSSPSYLHLLRSLRLCLPSPISDFSKSSGVFSEMPPGCYGNGPSAPDYNVTFSARCGCELDCVFLTDTCLSLHCVSTGPSLCVVVLHYLPLVLHI